jgi:threonine dehydrogenase-like Zn-dependent dehydrogenase
MRMQTDRPTVLREVITACRNGGTVSVPGVYGGFLDKVPFGAIVNKALTVKSGQTHVQRYMQPLLDLIEQGRIDPSFVISHHLPLEMAPEGFRMFRDKQHECTKIVLKPGMKREEVQQQPQRPKGDGDGTLH